MAKHGSDQRYLAGCRCKPCVSAHMSVIGSKGAKTKVKKFGKKYFSRIAALSHRSNNPDAKPRKNTGGRPKNHVAEGSGTR